MKFDASCQRCVATHYATSMAKSIYDSRLRDELRLYTRELLELVSKHYNIDIDDFVDKYAKEDGIAEDVSKCRACSKNNKGIVTLCLRSTVDGSQYCERHSPLTIKPKTMVLEYVKTSKGDFLYDPETLDVYSYATGSKKPELIGRMDEETRTIVVA